MDEKAIIARIEKLGFGAKVHAANVAAPVPQQDTAAQEMEEMRQRLIGSLILPVLSFISTWGACGAGRYQALFWGRKTS